MNVVAIGYCILYAFVLHLTAVVNAACPQGPPVSEMCVSSVRTGPIVWLDMSTANKEIQDCKCTFATTANTIKLMTYSAPNYPSCGTAVDVQTDSGANARFDCLMSGTFFDTMANKNGTITFEQNAPPFDKNYCLILEHVGRSWDSVTVTCTKTAAGTEETFTTSTLSSADSVAASTASTLAQAKQSSRGPVFSAPDLMSGNEQASLVDEIIASSNQTVELNSTQMLSGTTGQTKHAPTEKVTGAILFPGNTNDSKQKQYQSINLVNNNSGNAGSKTFNVESIDRLLDTFSENNDSTQAALQPETFSVDNFLETNQTGVKIEKATVDSMLLPNSKIALNIESINTNANAITELSSNNYLTGSNTSDLTFYENKTLPEPVAELSTKAVTTSENVNLQNGTNTKFTTNGLSDILTSLQFGSTGILRLSDMFQSQTKSTSHNSTNVVTEINYQDKNKTDSGVTMEGTTKSVAPTASITDHTTDLIQSFRIDSMPSTAFTENIRPEKGASNRLADSDIASQTQESPFQRTDFGVIGIDKNVTSSASSALEIKTIRFVDQPSEESARTAATPKSIAWRTTESTMTSNSDGLVLSNGPDNSLGGEPTTRQQILFVKPEGESRQSTVSSNITANTAHEISLETRISSDSTVTSAGGLVSVDQIKNSMTKTNIGQTITDHTDVAISLQPTDMSTLFSVSTGLTAQTSPDITAGKKMNSKTGTLAMESSTDISNQDMLALPGVLAPSTLGSEVTNASAIDSSTASSNEDMLAASGVLAPSALGSEITNASAIGSSTTSSNQDMLASSGVLAPSTLVSAMTNESAIGSSKVSYNQDLLASSEVFDPSALGSEMSNESAIESSVPSYNQDLLASSEVFAPSALGSEMTNESSIESSIPSSNQDLLASSGIFAPSTLGSEMTNASAIESSIASSHQDSLALPGVFAPSILGSEMTNASAIESSVPSSNQDFLASPGLFAPSTLGSERANASTIDSSVPSANQDSLASTGIFAPSTLGSEMTNAPAIESSVQLSNRVLLDSARVLAPSTLGSEKTNASAIELSSQDMLASPEGFAPSTLASEIKQFVDTTESPAIKFVDAGPVPDSSAEVSKIETSSEATSSVFSSELSEMTSNEPLTTPIDINIFYEIVRILQILSPKEPLNSNSVSEISNSQLSDSVTHPKAFARLPVDISFEQQTVEGLTSDSTRFNSLNNVQTTTAGIARNEKVNINTEISTEVKLNEAAVEVTTSSAENANEIVTQIDVTETTEYATVIADKSLAVNETTDHISAVTDKFPAIPSQLITDTTNALEDSSTLSKSMQVNKTMTEKTPVFVSTTKKAYSVVVEKVEDKHSETTFRGNRINKSTAKDDDDPSLFGIDRTVLIIILAAVGGAVLLLIIMALVVNRRRKKRTASAPITNHKFTVDNIIYDHGNTEDPEKGICNPMDTANSEENAPRPSTSNGIEARAH